MSILVSPHCHSTYHVDPLDPFFLVSDFLEVAVRGGSVSVVCSVRLAFPACVFLTSNAVRTSILAQAFPRCPFPCVL